MKLPHQINKTFKPSISIPQGCLLIVDTREQAPLFGGEKWCIRKTLKQGDYSIVGFEDRITIERKSVSDLLSSLGVERKRFEAELRRMEGYEWKGLVIEGLEKDVYTPNYYSSLHPNSIYQSLCSMEIRGFHIYYAESREKARWWVMSRLVKYYRIKREE